MINGSILDILDLIKLCTDLAVIIWVVTLNSPSSDFFDLLVWSVILLHAMLYFTLYHFLILQPIYHKIIGLLQISATYSFQWILWSNLSIKWILIDSSLILCIHPFFLSSLWTIITPTPSLSSLDLFLLRSCELIICMVNSLL